jgi:hypothetical protein
VRRYPALHCPLCGEVLIEAVVYGAEPDAREPLPARGYEYRCGRRGCAWVERHERRVEAR